LSLGALLLQGSALNLLTQWGLAGTACLSCRALLDRHMYWALGLSLVVAALMVLSVPSFALGQSLAAWEALPASFDEDAAWSLACLLALFFMAWAWRLQGPGLRAQALRARRRHSAALGQWTCALLALLSIGLATGLLHGAAEQSLQPWQPLEFLLFTLLAGQPLLAALLLVLRPQWLLAEFPAALVGLSVMAAWVGWQTPDGLAGMLRRQMRLFRFRRCRQMLPYYLIPALGSGLAVGGAAALAEVLWQAVAAWLRCCEPGSVLIHAPAQGGHWLVCGVTVALGLALLNMGVPPLRRQWLRMQESIEQEQLLVDALSWAP
jgi:hypothetical protein